MKDITKINTGGDLEAIRKKTAEGTRAKEPTRETTADRVISSDKIEVSERAEKIGKMIESVKELPAVRQDKVDAFREKILSNTYKPSSEDIAEAILKDKL